jgi:hypothetical protein
MQLRALTSAGIAIASCFLLISAASASVSDDQVTSQKIREADGTSGQNTNSGAGVKTNHLQNAAVTTTKIADGAISTPKLLDGAVTAQKLGIVCPDGQYLQYATAGGWTCSVGTPGPEGPQGPIGPQGPTGAEGPTAHYANVVVVAKSGGDFADPIAAMDSIADASATNPYVVKIMPGSYDLGSSYLTMKEYVDVEGSGTNITVIKSSHEDGNFGTLNAATNTEIRSLTVSHTAPMGGIAIRVHGVSSALVSDVTASSSGAGLSVAISVSEDASATLRNVSATASGSGDNYAIRLQSCTNSSVAMQNVTASVAGQYSTGIYVNNANAILDSVTVATSEGGSNVYGIYAANLVYLRMTNTSVVTNGVALSFYQWSGGEITIDHSILKGATSISNWGSLPILVGASKLVGASEGSGTVCAGCYDGNYMALDATCQ